MALQPQEQDIGTLMALFPDMVRAEALARLKVQFLNKVTGEQVAD